MDRSVKRKSESVEKFAAARWLTWRCFSAESGQIHFVKEGLYTRQAEVGEFGTLVEELVNALDAMLAW